MRPPFSKVCLALGIAGIGLACGGEPKVTDGGSPWGPTVVAKQSSLDKVDLLFAIDNSPSMGDKQNLLALAVPVLVARLLNPNCVANDTSQTCATAGDCSSLGDHAQCDVKGNGGRGQCFVAGDNGGGDNQCKSIAGTKPEFAPIHDLHIGIVSSSLGGGGSPDVCNVSGSDPTHMDDKGHLLNRTISGGTESGIANASPTDGNGGNFLAWLPASDPRNAGKASPNVTAYDDGQETNLVSDFKSLISGVQQTGCGLEAQLESWYRFLIQPDPWDSITLSSDSPPRAQYNGVDATLLKMRKDFLRPDSLVAIIQLTDEEDSWSDPMWLGGFGWTVRTNTFPGGPPGQGVGPRGTSECDQPVDANNPTTTGPNDPDCTSCAFPGSNKPVAGTPVGDDPSCQSCAGGGDSCPQKGWYSPPSPTTPIDAADGLNVRYGEQTMRRRYGLDPQYDVQRYVDGLRSARVPDRDHESGVGASSDVGAYEPVKNCTNPLYAADLPDGSDTSSGALCPLRPGSRTPDLVFYALLGGVPRSLVANGQPTADDWVKILGRDPAHYDFTGIDPHMIESTAPRPGLATAGATYGLGSDPDTGREWNTLTSAESIDLQYACTFDLPTPRDCSAGGASCDCSGTNGATTAADGPPLCDIANRSSQIKGKAYPTIRELRVAKALDQNAVVASICPQVVGDANDPDFGYNGAMSAVVDRLRSALANAWFPEALERGPDGTVSCMILVVYPNQTDQAAGCTDPGMQQPPSDVLSRFDSQYVASLGDAGSNSTQKAPVVCVYTQLPVGVGDAGGTCEGQSQAGWCYVEGAANTGGCAQALRFAGSGPPAGTTVDLERLP